MNKEVELQKMKDDIKYIKKSLTGNGEKGLMKKFPDPPVASWSPEPNQASRA